MFRAGTTNKIRQSPWFSATLEEMDRHLGQTALQQLVTMFDGSLRAIGSIPSQRQLEDWSVLVHEAMSGRGRSFHTTDHIFHIGADAGPLPSLAAIFHDVVYYQIDGGMTSRIRERVGSALEVRSNQEVAIAAFDPAADPQRALVLSLFGFTPGQVLSPFGGLNEFLSALLAARLLSEVINLSKLAQITTCIEATIPFRSSDAQGQTPFERLAKRLRSTNMVMALGLSEEEIESTLHAAVDIANRDIGNFAYEDTAAFLDNTWMLLPESNASLRPGSIYTMREYRIALQKMEGFMSNLKASNVFGAYRGVPDDATLADLTERAARNLRLGTWYLRTKLVAAAVLEAMAEFSGGDAPIALFMGDLPDKARHQIRLEHMLQPTPITTPDVDPIILHLVVEGRASETSFDLRNSPTAAFLYPALGTSGVERLLKVALEFFRGETSALDFLRAAPRDLLIALAKGCAAIAITRSEKLLSLEQALAG